MRQKSATGAEIGIASSRDPEKHFGRGLGELLQNRSQTSPRDVAHGMNADSGRAMRFPTISVKRRVVALLR
jgi:hypothetical protein